MVMQLVLQMLLLFWLREALAAPVAKPGCQDRCGSVTIPYPFGIGSYCSGGEPFEISCNRSLNPPKPFFTSNNLEVLEISLSKGTVRVNYPLITSNCEHKTDVHPDVHLSGPFLFSDTNRFTAMGCDNLALITHQEEVIGGCMSICNVTTKDRSCHGINCCQTTIPPFLSSINVTLRSLDSNNHRKECKYAFMVDQEWFTNLRDPYVVTEMEKVPAVLDWTTYDACQSYGTISRALCRTNAPCSNQTSSYVCHCDHGYEGNPYLPDGCQDIDECARSDTNTCEMICENMPGGYKCHCPPGYLSLKDRCRHNEGLNYESIITITVYGFGALLLLLGTLCTIKLVERRKKIKLKEKFFKRNGGLLLQEQLSSGEGHVEETKLFSLKELKQATDHFNENRILGQGGQGTVYKGMLSDGRIVAVKKSKLVDQGKLEQFINEVVILSQISHRNVVKLYGCCLETEVPLLVYEFIPNGTLFKYIHDENEGLPLSWDLRVRIAIEVAGALSYLHSAASIPIYHRDIKSTNIMLDDKYRAKVSDFGISRSIAVDQTHLTTKVQGTFGYLDPQYFQSSQFTDKSDVYSFGVVLVELLTGQKPISSTTSEEWRSLAMYFMLTMKENFLFDILDARVVKEGGKEDILRVANLAKRCLNLNGRKRPTMKEVSMELEAIRMSHGESTIEQNSEELVFEEAEHNVPQNAASTWTGPYQDDKASSTSDVLLSSKKDFATSGV